MSKEQILSKREQAKNIGVKPTWVIGDSNKKLDEAPNNKHDMILTCPPYYNLEIYSNDKDDISNLKTYEEFLSIYDSIIKKSINRLKTNRFIVYVVSNFRDKIGFMRDFVGDTIRLHEKYNCKFYNEIILLNSIGTLPIRTSHIFPISRKIGKRHQNILVFYKGDIKKIKDIYKNINTNSIKQNNMIRF